LGRYTEEQIVQQMQSLKDWKRTGNEIRRIVVATNFIHAMGFVQSVALLSEKADHHPDIDIRWNTVTLVLTTHGERGLTEKDFSLAAQINSLLKSQV